MTLINIFDLLQSLVSGFETQIISGWITLLIFLNKLRSFFKFRVGVCHTTPAMGKHMRVACDTFRTTRCNFRKKS